MSGRAKSTRCPGSPEEVYGTREAPGDAAVHNPGVVHRSRPGPGRIRDGFRMRAKRYGRCGTWLVLGFLLLLTAPTPTPRPPFLTPAATDTSVPAIGRGWPVGAARPTVLRGWEPPATVYGRGHRGVDL